MSTLKLRIFPAMCLIVAVSIVLSCATMEQFSKKYAGYTVVGKEKKEATRDVPVWILSCVMPNGAVRCEVESAGSYPSAGVNSCSMSCDGKRGDRWSKRQTGTKKDTYYKYLLRLKSPSGEVIDDEVTANIFDEVREGQVFPTTKAKQACHAKNRLDTYISDSIRRNSL